MESTEHLDQGSSPLPGCEDKKSREIYPLEAPCPHCGAELEFFSDELEKRQSLRCFQCKEAFTPAEYIQSLHS